MPALTHRVLVAVVAVVTVAALTGMVALWPDGPAAPADDAVAAQSEELVDATLLEVARVACEDRTGLLPDAVCVQMTARVDATGRVVHIEMTDDTGDTFSPGQRVRVAVVRTRGRPAHYVADFQRSTPLLVLSGLFVAAVVAFGRRRGLRALAGLALTFVVILGFVVPAILDGRNPMSVAVVGALVITVATLYLSHGFTPKTTAAVTGTALALLVTAGLAAFFAGAASLTGFTSEEAQLANVELGGLSLRGLLLAGIVLGGLGVLDDVTMSQASIVFELRRADPAAALPRLVRRALNVGRDHVAATVNTLFLAYAGAALPLPILFVVGDAPLGEILTSEVVAVEIVRTLVGSVGLIAAVPLTTALAAVVAGAEPRPASARGDVDAGASTPSAGDGEAWVEQLRRAYRLDPDD
ncbi:YibE/F family protein [soil metagenome]